MHTLRHVLRRHWDLLLILTILAVAVSYCTAQVRGQVIRPKDGWQETLEIVDGPAGVNEIRGTLAAVPLDDSGKWHVTLFVDGSAASARLLRDVQNDPYLHALAEWGHYNVYRLDSASQRARFAAFQVRAMPTLCVYPPPPPSVYPYCYVYRDELEWWDGQRSAVDLAREILAAIKSFAVEHNAGQCPGPWCPRPHRPDAPEPSPYVLPDIPPLPKIPPDGTDDDAKKPPLGQFPASPLITLIVDPTALGEGADAEALQALAADIRTKFPELSGAKARTISIEDDAAAAYPVTAEDTPAVVITHQGAIIGYISSTVLSVLKSYLSLPEPAVEPASTTDRLLEKMLDQMAPPAPAYAPPADSGATIGLPGFGDVAVGTAAGVGGGALLLALLAAGGIALASRGKASATPQAGPADLTAATEALRASKESLAKAVQEGRAAADRHEDEARKAQEAAKKFRAEL